MVVLTKANGPLKNESEMQRRIVACKKRFQDDFAVSLEDAQFVFVDSKDNASSDNQAQFRNIFSFIENTYPFQIAKEETRNFTVKRQPDRSNIAEMSDFSGGRSLRFK